MSLRSSWTQEAEVSFLGILSFLEGEWGALVADAFASDVLHTILLLEIFPNGGIIEVADRGIRSIPVARQVRLFYRVSSDTLVILELIDTRTERFQGT
jgi:plasmid stabilization system protein ParE